MLLGVYVCVLTLMFVDRQDTLVGPDENFQKECMKSESDMKSERYLGGFRLTVFEIWCQIRGAARKAP